MFLIVTVIYILVHVYKCAVVWNGERERERERERGERERDAASDDGIIRPGIDL